MNSSELVEDLKQFIDSRASQTEARLGERIDQLEQTMIDGFAGVAESIDRHNDEVADHEERIIKLESRHA